LRGEAGGVVFVSLASGAMRLKIESPFYALALRAVCHKLQAANYVHLFAFFLSLFFRLSERLAEVPCHVA